MTRLPTQNEAIHTQELLDWIVQESPRQSEVLLRQRQMVLSDIPAEALKKALTEKPETEEAQWLVSIIGCILSPGDKRRGLKGLGYDLTKQHPPGKQKSEDPIWRLVKMSNVELEFQADPTIPSWVRNVFKFETHCAMTGQPLNGQGQIDHKLPVARLGGYQELPKTKPSDTDEAERIARKFFQVISASANSRKREVCLACIRDNKRPGGWVQNGEKGQVRVWFFKGTTQFKAELGEKACEGCGFHDCAAWKEAFDAR